ncbi:unnamed protein product [Aphanomyces euteiches]
MEASAGTVDGKFCNPPSFWGYDVNALAVLAIVAKNRRGTFFNDLRIAIGQIQFHLAAYEDGVEENTDIHFKCFDVTRFQTHVLHPLCSTISIGIAVSFAISKIYQVLFAGFTHLTDVHVFRAAIATQLVGLLVSSLRTYITNSLQALHDAARDERYLIGKELTDMELHPKQC